MQGTGIGTSLILLATGAVLAMAIDYQVSGIDITAIGLILMIVGLIGLVFSLMSLGNADWFGSGTHVHEGHETHVQTTTREVTRETDQPVSEITTTKTTRRL